MNNLTTLRILTGRNIKLYFKDKVTFFMSMISPLILLVLFATFLKNVYESSFLQILPEGFTVDQSILNAFTGGWLMTSILGVSCVTIAFCSNIIMVDDRITGSITDLTVTPVRRELLAASYYLSNLLTTLIVCYIAMAAGCAYLGVVGWYLGAADILLAMLDVFLLVLFGTSLAAVVEYFIHSQGGISAVATLVSSMYGFLCGAYMPISQFSPAIRNFVSFIPGTYGTVLLRKHYMDPVIRQFADDLPAEAIEAMRDGFDMNLYFFEKQVQVWQMYLILSLTFLVLMGIYILIHAINNRKKKS